MKALQSSHFRLVFTALIIVLSLFFVWRQTERVGQTGETNSNDAVHEFDLGDIPNVLLHVENTHRYAPDTDDGAQDWNNLLPKKGQFLDAGTGEHQGTIAMFHQLHCLDAVRHAYRVRKEQTLGKFLDHCLNYLRQSILCQASLRLESVRGFHPPIGTLLSPEDDYVCRDWEAVYFAIERIRG